MQQKELAAGMTVGFVGEDLEGTIFFRSQKVVFFNGIG